MTRLFDVDGENLDRGFVNLRAAESRHEQQLHELIESLWATYEPYADPDFPQGFARDVDGRFWEMYLGCTLLEAGRALLPVDERRRAGGQPDLCVVEEGRRIWIEAIAPDEGDPGPDQIVRPVPMNEGGGLSAAPIRQAQLRTTSAFWTKAQKIARYLAQGVIGPDDVRIIAISASRFGVYVAERPLPLIMTSLFPIGDAFITIDRETSNVVEEGFHSASVIDREREPIPRTAFLDERFGDISGVLWSRVGLGNLSRQGRPLTYVHNPLAQVPLPMNWGVWDREFVTTPQGEAWKSTDILGSEPVMQVMEAPAHDSGDTADNRCQVTVNAVATEQSLRPLLDWADSRKVPQIGFAPDWTKHAKAAPFKRNDQMLDVLPIGVIVFPGTGIQDNLADKARKLGIPLFDFRPKGGGA